MIDLGKHDIIGVQIDALDYEAAEQRILNAVVNNRPYTVTALAVHGVMTGALDPNHRSRLNSIDLVTPDGQPVRWALNILHHTRLRDRVYGPNLMLRICARCAQDNIPVYFYGSTHDTVGKLTAALHARFPALRIAGHEPSLFRPLTDSEQRALADRISQSGARIAFIGLGCPLQEQFIHELKSLFNGVLFAVGAAFDFHAGVKPQAPDWMMNNGLEWFFRLACEPGRLWKRYLLLNPLYVLRVARQFITLPAHPRLSHDHTPTNQTPQHPTTTALPPQTLPSFRLSGVRIHAIQIDQAIAAISHTIANHQKGYVCVTGAHGMIEADQHPPFKNILNGALLNVPDGMPLVWIGRQKNHNTIGRVYGPDLMLEICARSRQAGWRHFLYGGKPGVADELRDTLTRRFPGLNIVGTYCPPFRPLTPDETHSLVNCVRTTQPNILWVGLSTPKQEAFMAEFLPQLDVNILIGVGAAFDLHTGRIKDAPAWVKHIGMQWFHRLCQEPLRLAPRYARIVPRFIGLALRNLLSTEPDPANTGNSAP